VDVTLIDSDDATRNIVAMRSNVASEIICVFSYSLWLLRPENPMLHQQAVEVVLRAAEFELTGQYWQLAFPISALYWPSAHAVQLLLAAFYWRRDWNHLPSQVRKNDMFGMEATNSPF